jgi:tRNA A37 N6-isopentenylltransferase MiaA
MELYVGSGFLLATAQVHATKTNKVKSLEVCKVASKTFKQYTVQEFMTFKAEDSPLQDIPVITLKERYNFMYQLIKERLNKNDDQRLIELNSLLNSLTKDEEDELIDVITVSMSNPGEVLL